VADDRTADLDDAYLFLDPNDNSRVIVAWTWLGFINPGEASNFGTFDPEVQFRGELELTGDTKPDTFLNVRFMPRPGPLGASQDVEVTLQNGKILMAKTPPATLAAKAPEPIITTDPATGIKFFVGLSDDPFFFDIPGFNRFAATAKAGKPDLT